MISRITLGEQFVHAVRIRGLTLTELSRRSTISVTTISSAVRGRPVNMTTAVRLCQAVKEAPVVDGLEEWCEVPVDVAS